MKVLNKKFISKDKFAEDIEYLVRDNKMNYIDAIIYFCECNGIDLESVPKLISKPLKEKIKYDAMELNFLKRTSRAVDLLIRKKSENLSREKFVKNPFVKMTPFDVYKTYLGLKNHPTKR